jgi:hypothetical protein
MKWVLHAFGLTVPNRDGVELYQIFTEFVRARHRENRDCVLIFDEAQLLNPETLEGIRLLSNINVRHETLLNIILVGQPELLETLSRPELAQFSQRVSVSFHLEPLGLREAHEYIRNRLRIAGGAETLFDEMACDAIFAISKGVPRQINVLCDTALIYGYADARSKIDFDIVWTVLKDRASTKNIDSMQIPRDISRTKLEKVIREARESELRGRESTKSRIAFEPEREVARSSDADRASLEPSADRDLSLSSASAPEQTPTSEIEAPLQIVRSTRVNSGRPAIGILSHEVSLAPSLSSNELRRQTCETDAQLAPSADVQLSLFGRAGRDLLSRAPFPEDRINPTQSSAKSFNIIPQDAGNGMQAPSPGRPLLLKPVASGGNSGARWWKKALLAILKP